jgi:hypothetical protein
LLKRTLIPAIAAAFAVAAPAWGATVSLSVDSATSDALHYRVNPVPAGAYIARFSTSLKGKGPQAEFRFADHEADGSHTWNGLFKPGERGLKLCIGQSSGGKLISAPSWDQVCTGALAPKQTSHPLAEALKVKVKRRTVVLKPRLRHLAGKFARVTIVIKKNPKAEGPATRKATRGVKLRAGRTTYRPELRPRETLKAAKIKIEDVWHRYAGTVKR